MSHTPQPRPMWRQWQHMAVVMTAIDDVSNEPRSERSALPGVPPSSLQATKVRTRVCPIYPIPCYRHGCSSPFAIALARFALLICLPSRLYKLDAVRKLTTVNHSTSAWCLKRDNKFYFWLRLPLCDFLLRYVSMSLSDVQSSANLNFFSSMLKTPQRGVSYLILCMRMHVPLIMFRTLHYALRWFIDLYNEFC